VEHTWHEITELPDIWKRWIDATIPGGKATIFHCDGCDTYMEMVPVGDINVPLHPLKIFPDCYEQMIFKILES
jgi:hypothetical protein